MTRDMKKFLRELELPKGCPTVDAKAVKRRVNAALNADLSERKAYMRQKIKLAAVLVAAVVALTGTALAVGQLDLLHVWFQGSTGPLAENIVPVDGSISNGTYTVRVEGVISDQYKAIVGISIQAADSEALKALTVGDRLPLYHSLLTFGHTANFQRLSQYDTADTLYFSVLVHNINKAQDAPLKLWFRESGPDSPYLSIPVNHPVETLEILPPPPTGVGWDYAVSRVAISPMSLEVEVDYPKPLHANVIFPLYFRMADSTIQTLSQFFAPGYINQLSTSSYGVPWDSISLIDEREDGSCTYLYSATLPVVLDLLSVEGVITQGMEYSFLNPEKSVPIEIDKTLVPFTVSFAQLDDGSNRIPVEEVCLGLGANFSMDTEGKSATIIYRGITMVLNIGSTTATMDGKSIQLEAPPVLQNGILLSWKDVWNCFQVGVQMHVPEHGSEVDSTTIFWLVMP